LLRKGNSQGVPDTIALSIPWCEPAHTRQPQRTVCLSEILTELEYFEEFSIGSDRRHTRDEDPDKRGFVPTHCPRRIVSLAINDDVLKKYRLAVKRQAIGSCCGVRTAVNGCEGVPEADLVGEEAVCVRRHVSMLASRAESIWYVAC